ncbi:MAG: hypothetical protein RL292_557 [Candidatus Parcubacteria bacterium]|jgi:hypothetical protein
MRKATLAQRDKLWEMIDQDGTPREQVQNLLASGLLPDFLNADFTQQIDRDELRRILNLKPLEYTFSVDYDMSISEAMKYDGTGASNCAIVDRNFPSTRTGKVSKEAYLVKMDQTMSVTLENGNVTSRDVLLQMGIKMLRPADLRELLAFARRYPTLVRQRRFHIVALGSIYQSSPTNTLKQVCGLTLMDYPKDEINLSLLPFDEEWDPKEFRFLAVPQ